MIDFIKNIFIKQKQANVPVLQELLIRDEAQQQAYHAWKVANKQTYLLGFLQKEINKLNDGSLAPQADNILIINSPKSRGFILKYNSVQADTDEFAYLADYLKERILKLNYKLYVSDVKNYARKNYVETIERHYLKPRFGFNIDTKEKVNQQYGNIVIEHLLHNKQSVQLKFLNMPYTDHKYTAALSFEGLMERILVS